MAISKTLFVSILMSLLMLNLVESDTMVINTNSLPPKIDCESACNRRCQLSSRPHLCKRACGTCCTRCNCVPSGTYGHYEECPCYANMTTHGGKRKCP